MKQESSSKSRVNSQPLPSTMRSRTLVVIGSALFWAWGFLCFLSPVIFPAGTSSGVSIGIEYGFFASQACAVLFAVAVVVSRWTSIVLRRGVFLIAALLISLSSMLLVWSLQASLLWLTILCGALDGVCIPLMGVAWGTRYSLDSKNIRPLVVLSFLVSYFLYFAISWLPHLVAILCVCIMPIVSWALWHTDARARHELSPEVFPVRGAGGEPNSPGEVTAGSWEAKILPWRSIAVLVAAAFVGNLVASVIMGQGYNEVEGLFQGGVLVCACIATMTLVPLTAGRNRLSASSVYRITLTFTAIGLVIIMVFGGGSLALGGALVQGCALFLQVLVIVIITQSTQEQGLSPLLSFSVGQGLIAGIVFFANILGKQVFVLFGSHEWLMDALCGISLLVLFFMLVARANEPKTSQAQPTGVEEFGKLDAIKEANVPTPDQVRAAQVGDITDTYGLTKREAEVLGYLGKGRSLPYIADTLFVTTGTIKTHTTNIYRKLAVNSRQELLDLFESD